MARRSHLMCALLTSHADTCLEPLKHAGGNRGDVKRCLAPGSETGDILRTGTRAVTRQIGVTETFQGLGVGSLRWSSGFWLQRSWRRPRGQAYELSDPLEPAEYPQIAINAMGDAVAAWREGDSERRIRATYRPAGGSWEEPVALSPVGMDSIHQQVAIDDAGTVTVVWRGSDGADEVIQAVRRPASGKWGRRVTDLSVVGADTSAPQVAADANGKVIAVWKRGEIIQASSRPPAGDWGLPVDLSVAGGDALQPHIAFDPAGNAIAIWRRWDGATYRVQAATRAPGGKWRSPVDLSPAGVRGDAPQLAIDEHGTAMVVWRHSDPDDSYYRVQAARKSADETWQPPVTISPAGEDVHYPQIATDAAGNAVAVWLSNAGSSWLIRAAVFDGAGPELRSLAIPAAGRIGEQLSFSVSPFDPFSPLGPTSWSFGDGAAGVGNSSIHAYEQPGDYVVTVTAADALGNETSARRIVRITAVPGVLPPADPGAKPKPRVLARANPLARFSRGAALLRLRCPNAGRCLGVVRLAVVVRQKRQRKLMAIGRARVGIAAGKRRNIQVRLNRAGKRRLALAVRRGHGLRAVVAGNAVEVRRVVLVARR